jgi:hypothetical protein
MQKYTLSKFYRPENVVEHVVSLIKDSGGILDKIRYPKPDDDTKSIWVTFTKDGMPGAYRITKGMIGPYRVFSIQESPLFYDEDVAVFMVEALRSLPDIGTLETTRRDEFESICKWLRRDSRAVLRSLR